jgi:hypothetical protein
MQLLRNVRAPVVFAIQDTSAYEGWVSDFPLVIGQEVMMGLLNNLKLRNRAYGCAYNSFRFAARLRGDLSEFAPSIAETIQSVGDELAALARDACPSDRERKQLIDGLEGALRTLGLSDAAQVHIVSQLAPRIMAGIPISGGQLAWTRIAV